MILLRTDRRSLRRCATLCLALGLAGCAAPRGGGGIERVETAIIERARLDAAAVVDPADGIDETEALALALRHEPGFRAALCDVGLSELELEKAGWYANPSLSLLFPVGPKQLEFAVRAPLEWIWLRPRRVSLARANAEREVSRLITKGGQLISDVREAAARCVSLEEQARVEEGIEQLERARRDDLTERRDAGIVGEDALIGAQVAFGRAHSGLSATRAELARARIRLCTFCALDDPEVLRLSPWLPTELPSLATCRDGALSWRPEIRTAEIEVERLCTERGIGRWNFVHLTGIADANGSGSQGFEIGPGVDVSLPVFDWGRLDGRIGDLQVERARRRLEAERARVLEEVQDAYVRVAALLEERGAWRREVHAPLLRRAEQAAIEEEEGSIDRAGKFAPLRDLLHAERDGAITDGELRRAWIALERAVGRRWTDLGEAAPPSAMAVRP